MIFSACSDSTSGEYLLIRGGTLINPSTHGTVSKDITNAFVLIKDSIIVDYGELNDNAEFPENCVEIDASGKYIMPGLIDGFGTINNQNYANAYLQAGVTSIIGVESLRRGELFLDGDPSPNIFLMGEAGDVAQTNEEIIEDFRMASEKGFGVMLLMYKLTPDQLKLAVKLADKYNIATIGELGYTSYKEASDLGVESFVHVTRYSLDTAPSELQKAVADEPFSNDLDSPKWQYYRYLSNLDTGSTVFTDHAKMLGSYKGYVIPTLSLLYLDMPDHGNPWDDPLAGCIDPEDVNNPADAQTGNHDYDSIYQAAYTKMGIKQMDITFAYYRHGVKFLSGSAADVWGTMPGISLHTELELLHRAGLSNREVIAAATTNFADAFGWNRGKIEEGYCSDIIILKNDPLKDIKNLRDIEMLILGGKLVFKK
jgi:hypothetical protein